MPASLKTSYPLRVIIGQEDVTAYLDQNFTFSSVDPGGFEMCQLAFPRDMPQTIRGQNIRIDSGLHVAWEGRVAQVQRSLGSRTTITGEGYGALLKDVTLGMVFVDRDLTRWQNASVARQAQNSSTFNPISGQVAADPANNAAAIVQTVTDSWTTIKPMVESWYDAGSGNLISTIWYDRTYGGQVGTGQNWVDAVFLSIDAVATTFEATSNLYNSGSLAEVSGYFTPATPYRYGILQHSYSTTNSGTQGFSYPIYWHNIAAYGNHGLTGRGSDPVGYYPSDIAWYAASQASGLQQGVVQQTDSSGYIVPHSAYYTPVTLDQIVSDMATAAGWHYGVWESPTPLTGSALPRFDFRPRPQLGTYTASCRRQDCDTLDLQEDLSGLYDSVVVTYSDVTGIQNAVTVTTSNPLLVQAGIHRTAVLNGGTMTSGAAATFGQIALGLLYTQARVAGSAVINTEIDMSGPSPAWQIKPGIDRLRIVDLPSTDAWGQWSDLPVTRMECSVSTSGMTTTLEFGIGGASLVEVLQARLQAASVLAGQGG